MGPLPSGPQAALVAFAVVVYAFGYRPAAGADSYYDVNAQLAEIQREAMGPLGDLFGGA